MPFVVDLTIKLEKQPIDCNVNCPLCQSLKISEFHRDKRRPYFQCDDCHLVFVPPEFYHTPAEERAEYERHQNDPNNPGYRRFLSRLFDPLVVQLKPGDKGLDFGCSPGPTLSIMFEEAGFPVSLYDPFFAPDRSVLIEQGYDFITATEVLEHLHDPRGNLDALWNCLKPSGVLGIMTKWVIDQAAFSRWHYIQDPTHVCFFSRETLAWLADFWQAKHQCIEPDVALFWKGFDA